MFAVYFPHADTFRHSLILTCNRYQILWKIILIKLFLLLSGHSVRLLGQKKDGGRRLGGARLDLPKIRKNPLIEIISINTG